MYITCFKKKKCNESKHNDKFLYLSKSSDVIFLPSFVRWLLASQFSGIFITLQDIYVDLSDHFSSKQFLKMNLKYQQKHVYVICAQLKSFR